MIISNPASPVYSSNIVSVNGQTDQSNTVTSYTYPLPDAIRQKLEAGGPNEYFALVLAGADSGDYANKILPPLPWSGSRTGPYWSNLKQFTATAPPAHGINSSGTSGHSSTKPVGTMQLADAGEEPDVYATINWRDGTTDTTQYNQANGGIVFSTDANGNIIATVDGTHEYAAAGVYAVRITFHAANGNELAVADSLDTITNAISVSAFDNVAFERALSRDYSRGQLYRFGQFCAGRGFRR